VALLLRKIRRSRWLSIEWLSEPDFQADALTDLRTSNNRLSVWIVDDDRSNMQHVISALAVNVDSLSNLDYALIAESALAEIGVRLEHTRGDSADDVLNSSHHRDIIELSGRKLLELAVLIRARAETNRVSEKHVKGFVADGHARGRIDRARVKLKPGELDKLG
jgi:hypothetical protein